MQYFGAQLCTYDTDIIQLFEALADFTQPIELQKKPWASSKTCQQKRTTANHGSYISQHLIGKKAIINIPSKVSCFWANYIRWKHESGLGVTGLGVTGLGVTGLGVTGLADRFPDV